MSFHPVFNNIVGQTITKSALSLSLANAATMKQTGVKVDLAQPLLLGEAGLGKTELARCYARQMSEILDIPFVEVSNPEDIRLMTVFEKWLSNLESMPSFVLFVDEVHKIGKDVAHKYLHTFLLKMLDRQNVGQSVQVSDKYFIPDRANKIIILGTNVPGKVDPAIKSRMQNFNLSLYNRDEIKAITNLLFDSRGLQVESERLSEIIAGCGRGTARPIVNLVDDSLLPMTQNFGSNIVTQTMTMEALKHQEMYPLGLKKPEVEMLMRLKSGILTKNQIIMSIPALDGVMSQAVAYCSNCNLVQVATNSMIALTKKGKRYINDLAEFGFFN